MLSLNLVICRSFALEHCTLENILTCSFPEDIYNISDMLLTGRGDSSGPCCTKSSRNSNICLPLSSARPSPWGVALLPKARCAGNSTHGIAEAVCWCPILQGMHLVPALHIFRVSTGFKGIGSLFLSMERCWTYFNADNKICCTLISNIQFFLLWCGWGLHASHRFLQKANRNS